MKSKWIRRLAIGLTALAVLVAAFYAVENWRGKRAWEKYKAEQEALGVSFDWESFIPEPVPDDQNMAKAPPFDDLFVPRKGEPRLAGLVVPSCDAWVDLPKTRIPTCSDWIECRTNSPTTAYMQTNAPLLEEVVQATIRPYFQLPSSIDPLGGNWVLDLSMLRKLARVQEFHAMAALCGEDADTAFTNVLTGLRLGNALQGEADFATPQTSQSIRNCMINSVWVGLARRQWTEKHLATFQNALEQNDEISNHVLAMRGEALTTTLLLQNAIQDRLTQEQLHSGIYLKLYRLFPKGWHYLNMIDVHRFYTLHYIPAFDVEAHRIYPSRVDALCLDLFKRDDPYAHQPKFILRPMLRIWVFLRIYSTAKPTRLQTSTDHAALACALERYWMKHGAYPDELQALVPEFIAKLPTDVITGESYHYAKTDNGRFKIWSVGWNQTDEGGVVDPKDSTQGDWVWQYPAKSAATGNPDTQRKANGDSSGRDAPRE
jgi:hypothetical protein